MSSEKSIDIYTLSCVKQIASGKLRCVPGSSAWCSVMIYKVGCKVGVGRRLTRMGIYVDIADSSVVK